MAEHTDPGVMPPEEVAEIHNEWSGSHYEGAILRLCDSHETLRAELARYKAEYDPMPVGDPCPYAFSDIWPCIRSAGHEGEHTAGAATDPLLNALGASDDR